MGVIARLISSSVTSPMLYCSPSVKGFLPWSVSQGSLEKSMTVGLCRGSLVKIHVRKCLSSGEISRVEGIIRLKFYGYGEKLLLLLVDLLEEAKLCLVPIGELIVDHAIQGYAESPHINRLPIEALNIRYMFFHLYDSLTIATLRRHKLISALSLAKLIFLLLCEKLTHAKVTDFCLHFLIYEDVLGLNIPMNYVIRVHYTNINE
jgi:hypothetical protein